MQYDRLEHAVNCMLNILSAGGNPRLARLYHDVLNHYYMQYAALSDQAKRVWDTSINLRLKNIDVPQKVFSSQISSIKQMFSGYTTYPDIRFGQIRVGPTFQGAANVNQQAMVGMPNVQGQGILAYGRASLNNVANSDILPVAIFWNDDAGCWIAANNRGFAAHCAGGIRPLRLLPREPEQAETNRLAEVEGQGNIPDLAYNPGVVHRLNQRPHRLPSLQMPITTGPNTWTIEAVVDRPRW